MFKRRIRSLILSVIVLFSIMMTSAYYLTSTQKGACLILKVFLSRYFKFDDVLVREQHGGLFSGLVLKDIKIISPQELPKGSVLKMGEIRFMPLFSFGKEDWLGFKIYDLRWKSPYSLKDVVIKEVRGRPDGGLWFYGVESEGLNGLPKNSLLEIQKLNALFSLKPNDLQSIEGGRVDLPHSTPVTFSGRRAGQDMEARIRCQNLDLKDVAELFANDKKASGIEGTIDGFEVSVSNVFQKDSLQGEIRFQKFVYHDFTLTDCVAVFDVVFKMTHGKIEVQGRIDLKQGTIVWKGNVIKLLPGKIVFSGDPLNPVFYLRGASVIENTVVSVTLKGPKNALDFKLSSDSGLSQKRLFFMFMVGKSLKNILFMPFLAVANSP